MSMTSDSGKDMQVSWPGSWDLLHPCGLQDLGQASAPPQNSSELSGQMSVSLHRTLKFRKFHRGPETLKKQGRAEEKELEKC